MAIVSRGLAALMNASTLFLYTHCEVSGHSCVLQDRRRHAALLCANTTQKCGRRAIAAHVMVSFFFYELNIRSSEEYGKNTEKHANKTHGGVQNAGRGRAVNCAANCADQCEQNLSNELCSFPDELDFRKKSSARALYYSSQPCKCVGAGGQSRATSNSLLALEVTPSFLRTSRFR